MGHIERNCWIKNKDLSPFKNRRPENNNNINNSNTGNCGGNLNLEGLFNQRVNQGGNNNNQQGVRFANANMAVDYSPMRIMNDNEEVRRFKAGNLKMILGMKNCLKELSSGTEKSSYETPKKSTSTNIDLFPITVEMELELITQSPEDSSVEHLNCQNLLTIELSDFNHDLEVDKNVINLLPSERRGSHQSGETIDRDHCHVDAPDDVDIGFLLETENDFEKLLKGVKTIGRKPIVIGLIHKKEKVFLNWKDLSFVTGRKNQVGKGICQKNKIKVTLSRNNRHDIPIESIYSTIYDYPIRKIDERHVIALNENLDLTKKLVKDTILRIPQLKEIEVERKHVEFANVLQETINIHLLKNEKNLCLNRNLIDETSSESLFLDRSIFNESYYHSCSNNYYNDINFIFDSGCTRHICPSINYFDYFQELEGDVVLGNGEIVKSYGFGNVGVLEDVLFVPDICMGLISISQLDEKGYKIIFNKGTITVYDSSNNEFLKGIKKDKLYFIVNDENCGITDENHHEYAFANLPNENDKKRNLLEIWHDRWGHPSETVMKKAIENDAIEGLNISKEQLKKMNLRLCPQCYKGKMTHLPSHESTTDLSNYKNFEILCTDEKGPFKVESYPNKWKHLDLFSFKSSHYVIALFKRRKDEYPDNLQHVLNFVNCFEGERVKEHQSDDGSIYQSSIVTNILNENGIMQRIAPRKTPSDNGWIEREMRSVFDKAITIMQLNNCPLRFWPFAIETAVYLLNRTPKESLGWKTPYEKVFNKKPNLSHLVSFYAPGMAYVSKEEREHNLSPKAYECRMLGYDESGKETYIIFIPELNVIRSMRTVKFDQSRLPKENANIEREPDDHYDDRFQDLHENEVGPYAKDDPNFYHETLEEKEEEQEGEMEEENQDEIYQTEIEDYPIVINEKEEEFNEDTHPIIFA